MTCGRGSGARLLVDPRPDYRKGRFSGNVLTFRSFVAPSQTIPRKTVSGRAGRRRQSDRKADSGNQGPHRLEIFNIKGIARFIFMRIRNTA